MSTKAPKRSRSSRSTSGSSDSDREIPPQPVQKNTWPRFLVICPTNHDQPLNKLSPFAILKALQGLAGDPKDVKVLRSGNILVEFDKKVYSDKLLRSKEFVNIPIQVSPHQSLNYSKGVVRSRDLQNTTEEEMLKELKDQNVTNVKRISFMKNGKRITTNTFILTFDIPVIPPSIKAGFLNINVDPYIPNPLRCFNCQRFGHHKDKCTKQSICAKCGREGHDSNSCENPVCCFNCKGDHFAYSKECEKWKQEKEIQSIKVLRRVSFVEARKLVETSKPAVPTGGSYASKVKTTRSTGVQTEITWPNGCENFSRITFQTVTDSGKKDASSQSNQNISQKSDQNRQRSPIKLQDKTTPRKKSGGDASPLKTTPRKKSEGDAPLKKGQPDPILLSNKYTGLDGEESMDELPSLDPPPKSQRKKKKKKIIPVTPPI